MRVNLPCDEQKRPCRKKGMRTTLRQRTIAPCTTSIIGLLTISLFLGGECHDMMCSNFDYDEQLLEKMVRMEFAFENILQEVKATKDEVKTELNTLREERNQFKSEVSTLKQIIDDALKDNLATSRETFDVYESKINQMSDDLKTFKNQALAELKGLLPEPLPRIEFKAHDCVDMTPAKDQVMVFNEVDYNKGQGYNANTGYFTSPVTGTYLFMIQVCIKPHNFMYFDIVVDDVVPTSFQASAYDYNCCLTWVSIANVNVGSKAFLKARGSTERNIFQQSATFGNIFSGILINETP